MNSVRISCFRFTLPLRRAEDGQSMIEFALCLPLLLTVVMGICAFGVAMENYTLMTEATGVAARQIAISRGQTTDPCSLVRSYLTTAAPGLKAASMTTTLYLNGTKYTASSCPSASSTATANMVQNTAATINVTYPCNLYVYKYNFANGACVLTAQTTELMQ